MFSPEILAVFKESTHFQLWTYIIATPLGGLSLFVGYLLLSWAWNQDQGRSIWVMVAGLVVILGLRFWSGDFTYGFIGAVMMLFRIAPEVKHLEVGRWGRNCMILGLVSYLVGILNFPLALPKDLTEAEMFALQTVHGMGRRSKKEERRQRIREANGETVAAADLPDDEDEDDEDKPRRTPPPAPAATPVRVAAVATAPPTPPPAAVAPQSYAAATPWRLSNAADVLREGLALKAKEKKLVERKTQLNTKDREAVQWLTEDILRYNAEQQAFHQAAVKIDPNYLPKLEAAAKATPTPAPAKKKK